MAATPVTRSGHQLHAHANVREDGIEYLIELDVSDFTENELTIEAIGPRLTVRGEQLGAADEDDKPFHLRECFEASFRLPDDADLDQISVFFRHGTLEIHAVRTLLEQRRLPIERPPSHEPADTEI